MNIVQTIALTLGVAWASGINLYASILMLGVLGATDSLALPHELQVLANPLVIIAAGVMYCIEFFVDKIPGVDSGWDVIHSFIRIPAGAVLAAAAVGDVSAPVHLAAAIIGGTLAAGTHVTKAGARLAINTSPEPVSNWFASLAEDAAVFVGLWCALNQPWLFLALLVLFILFVVWLFPKIWAGIKRLFKLVSKPFKKEKALSAKS